MYTIHKNAPKIEQDVKELLFNMTYIKDEGLFISFGKEGNHNSDALLTDNITKIKEVSEQTCILSSTDFISLLKLCKNSTVKAMYMHETGIKMEFESENVMYFVNLIGKILKNKR